MSSLYAIQTYYHEVEKLIHYGGTRKETAIRNAFCNLLNQYAEVRDLKLVPELSLKTRQGKVVTPDGTLKDVLRLDHGYWESKDESDDLNEEIQKKFRKGYPSDNILFEDSLSAVLYQHGSEVLRVPMSDGEELDKLLNRFINFERQEVKEFRKAIEQFKLDIPKVTEAIREIIDSQERNAIYKKTLQAYTELCRQSINPEISIDDIKEMMVQHILSADIFNTIFDEPHFHQENNIARELNKLISTFFIGTTRRQTLGRIKHYYDTINAKAASIADHHEKQHFLKVVYENFYKAYNPKAADRLGIVYTPREVVQFMIRSTDYLLYKHFGKTLDCKNVEILDPATGTGTFICDIIDYLPKHKLEHKYRNELHANEIAILPYYIANLNIEYVYKQKMGQYAEFENLCLVDTLDNTAFNWQGKQGDLFGVSVENAARIRKQNARKISVIIGNPPYNANQANENDNNKNRQYPAIDKRIKETFIKNSTAQKTKMYDPYSRFYRWAMDRLDENGIIAFVSNRSFIDSRTFDGFRKTIQQDFDYAYIIDTKSDVRANPKIAGTTHNVFGIQTGVAILFLVKAAIGKSRADPCRIGYASVPDEWRKEEKLQWLVEHPIEKIQFEHITPDKNSSWINLAENAWEDFIPLCSKETKSGRNDGSIFRLFANGIKTNRDEWVYDLNKKALSDKMRYFIKAYNREVDFYKDCKDIQLISNKLNYSIKWSRDLKNKLLANKKTLFKEELITGSVYRPFVKKHFYSEKLFNDVFTDYHFKIFGNKLSKGNLIISISGLSSAKPFQALASKTLSDYECVEKSIYLPFFVYSLEKCDSNITDWALQQFQKYYQSKGSSSRVINKEDIFHYVYAVLHNPSYRKKYELNLKREFPRIPLYNNFFQWATWGYKLMDLHINYEQSAPFKVNRMERIINKISPKEITSIQKPQLKARKEKGLIIIDDITELHDIPVSVWDYKLGNRSALEWILDQYKVKKSSDSTIVDKFDTYRFSDHKERVIDLLKRVCTVSVETMKIINQMEKHNNAVISEC